MIVIQQDSVDVNNIEGMINRQGDIPITVDTEAIQVDLEKLVEKGKNPLSSFDKKNIKRVISYLNSILHYTKGTRLNLTWKYEEGLLKSSPVELIHIPEYNIEMSDYISVIGNKLIRVDYKNLIKIIAVELMYRDLGETHESMEKKLYNVGITGMYPDSELLKYFEEDVYNLSKQFKVGDSPYASKDKQGNIDYFGQKRFHGQFYRDIVDYSVKYALTLIAGAIMAKFNSNNVDFKLCSVSDSGVYFTTTHQDDEDINKLIIDESAIVRAFGRKFIVKPKITIF